MSALWERLLPFTTRHGRLWEGLFAAALNIATLTGYVLAVRWAVTR